MASSAARRRQLRPAQAVQPDVLIDVAIDELKRHELTFAAGVLARVSRHPVTIAILGDDPGRRMRRAERLVGGA